MNDRIVVEVVYGGHEALLELLLGGDADVAQDRTGELGEEALDEVEPGAMFGSEGEPESPAIGEPSSRLPGDRICVAMRTPFSKMQISSAKTWTSRMRRRVVSGTL